MNNEGEAEGSAITGAIAQECADWRPRLHPVLEALRDPLVYLQTKNKSSAWQVAGTP